MADDWDPEKENVRGKTIQVKEVNQHIDDIRHKIRSKYRMLKESEVLITAKVVKDAYEGIHSSQKGHRLKELTDYYKKITKLPLITSTVFWNIRTRLKAFTNIRQRMFICLRSIPSF